MNEHKWINDWMQWQGIAWPFPDIALLVGELYGAIYGLLQVLHHREYYDFRQGLCQDLATGCPKLAIVKFLGVQVYIEPQYTQISTINILNLSK